MDNGEAPRTLRIDHVLIASLIRENSRVLDLGCADGELLDFLVKKKHIHGSGIEINEQAIYRCVAKGLSVCHEDIDSGLTDYPEGFFDYVIFNQTIQQVHKPRQALARALLIGKRVIVGFPNFCNFNARLQIFFSGRVPVTPSLPYNWYDTPNLHFLSIKDFIRFCGAEKIAIEKSFFISGKRRVPIFPNLFATGAIFLLSK